MQICEEIIQVNENICGIRPTHEINDDEAATLKINYRRDSGRSTKRNRTCRNSGFAGQEANRSYEHLSCGYRSTKN